MEPTCSRELRASADQAMRFFCPLYDSKRGDVASGIAVKIEKRYFIATVAHFLKDADPDSLVVVRKEAERNIVGDFNNVDWSLSLDVGLIELTECQAKCLPSFACKDHILATASFDGDTCFFVSGAPAQIYERCDSQTFSVPMIYNVFPLPPEEWPENTTDTLAVDVDCILKLPEELTTRRRGSDYPSEGGDLRAGPPPHPAGMSGGGIWLPGWRRAPVSYPQVQLVGLQRSFFEESRLLRGIRIECWLKFVADVYEELAEPIGKMLCRSVKLDVPKVQE